MKEEPVAIVAAINAAITATIALLAFFTDITPDAIGALTLVATAWIGVISAWVRSRVTPVGNP